MCKMWWWKIEIQPLGPIHQEFIPSGELTPETPTLGIPEVTPTLTCMHLTLIDRTDRFRRAVFMQRRWGGKIYLSWKLDNSSKSCLDFGPRLESCDDGSAAANDNVPFVVHLRARAGRFTCMTCLKRRSALQRNWRAEGVRRDEFRL